MNFAFWMFATIAELSKRSITSLMNGAVLKACIIKSALMLSSIPQQAAICMHIIERMRAPHRILDRTVEFE